MVLMGRECFRDDRMHGDEHLLVAQVGYQAMELWAAAAPRFPPSRHEPTRPPRAASSRPHALACQCRHGTCAGRACCSIGHHGGVHPAVDVAATPGPTGSTGGRRAVTTASLAATDPTPARTDVTADTEKKKGLQTRPRHGGVTRRGAQGCREKGVKGRAREGDAATTIDAAVSGGGVCHLCTTAHLASDAVCGLRANQSDTPASTNESIWRDVSPNRAQAAAAPRPAGPGGSLPTEHHQHRPWPREKKKKKTGPTAAARVGVGDRRVGRGPPGSYRGGRTAAGHSSPAPRAVTSHCCGCVVPTRRPPPARQLCLPARAPAQLLQLAAGSSRAGLVPRVRPGCGPPPGWDPAAGCRRCRAASPSPQDGPPRLRPHSSAARVDTAVAAATPG